ncbi:hypothetical protein AVEN_259244-1, partial [Araneus ventricosus]
MKSSIKEYYNVDQDLTEETERDESIFKILKSSIKEYYNG